MGRAYGIPLRMGVGVEGTGARSARKIRTWPLLYLTDPKPNPVLALTVKP